MLIPDGRRAGQLPQRAGFYIQGPLVLAVGVLQADICGQKKMPAVGRKVSRLNPSGSGGRDLSLVDEGRRAIWAHLEIRPVQLPLAETIGKNIPVHGLRPRCFSAVGRKSRAYETIVFEVRHLEPSGTVLCRDPHIEPDAAL